jgi:dTMP kinase
MPPHLLSCLPAGQDGRATASKSNRIHVMGKFITFEGIEGSGKTTQIRAMGDFLRRRHISFLVTEEPGGTPLGRKIRKILLNRGTFELSDKAELLLFSAARAQHVKDIIVPALKEGKVILCDRFSDATIAYQGFGRGFSLDFIRLLNEFSTNGIRPDLTIVLDLPVKIGVKRAMERIFQKKEEEPEDRFEREHLSFHEKIRKGYLSLAKHAPERFRIIDALKDIETVQKEVQFHVMEFIKG